jgi:hypothetical protein
MIASPPLLPHELFLEVVRRPQGGKQHTMQTLIAIWSVDVAHRHASADGADTLTYQTFL